MKKFIYVVFIICSLIVAGCAEDKKVEKKSVEKKVEKKAEIPWDKTQDVGPGEVFYLAPPHSSKKLVFDNIPEDSSMTLFVNQDEYHNTMDIGETFANLYIGDEDNPFEFDMTNSYSGDKTVFSKSAVERGKNKNGDLVWFILIEKKESSHEIKLAICDKAECITEITAYITRLAGVDPPLRPEEISNIKDVLSQVGSSARFPKLEEL